MSEHLATNPWGIITHHPTESIVELAWLPSTTTMGDGGFMATLCLFAWEAEKTRPRGLLIDAVQFRHQFGSGVMEWRDAHIIPRYGAAGVQRFAFLMPARFPQEGKEAVEGPAIFPTKWFTSRDDAFRWLTAK